MVLGIPNSWQISSSTSAGGAKRPTTNGQISSSTSAGGAKRPNTNARRYKRSFSQIPPSHKYSPSGKQVRQKTSKTNDKPNIQKSEFSTKRQVSTPPKSPVQAVPPKARPVKSSSPTTAKCSFAFVTLVMKGDAYVEGALVMAHSLRMTGTKYDIVCMVTPDVSDVAIRRLRIVFTKVVVVQYLKAHCRKMRTPTQRTKYDHWINSSFTKWRCLQLNDYEKRVYKSSASSAW